MRNVFATNWISGTLLFGGRLNFPFHTRESLDCGYRLDIVVQDSVVVELKSIEHILPIHQAQLLTYLRLSGKRVGLIINFNVAVLKNGIVIKVL